MEYVIRTFWLGPWVQCASHTLAAAVSYIMQCQGGHGTGKTGNLVLTFSRQGKHREFCSDAGKNLLTQGKYLDCDY